MKAVQIRDQFGLDNLQLVDLDPPQPGPGELLLGMKAASLNFRDLMMVRGHYNPRQPLPLVPCSDGVGTVLETGAGVEGFEPGERVCPIFSQSWLAGAPDAATLSNTLGGPLDGTLRERMTVKAAGVVRVPEHLSDAQAATLPCAAITAWSALVEHAEIGAGDTILTLGTGGVSIFALQLGQLLGARVIVTSSSDQKLERATELGAWKTINYREDTAWGKTVQKLTGGRGADLVVEVGGSDTLAQSLRAVRPGGQISLIGVLSGNASELNILPILMRNVRVQGIFTGHRLGFEAMNRAIDVHRLEPVVDRVVPLADARSAFDAMAAGDHFGKICVEIS